MSPFRVATYNVRSGRGVDGVVDIERIAAVVRALGAELVAVQELDRGLERTGRVDQPRELARLTGMSVRFFSTVRRGRGEYGHALASAETLDAAFEPLPRVRAEEPRGAIVAAWRRLSVVAVHLAWQKEVAALQARALADLVSRLRPPALVLGDMNLSRRFLRPLTEAGFDAGPRRHTFTSTAPVRQIDHVLAGPGLRVERAWTLRSRASDHRPLVAEVSGARPTRSTHPS